MSESPHPIIQARRAQMFPTLAPADIDRLRRFGETRSYGSGERLIRAGDVAPGLIVILSGKVEVTQGRGLDQREIIVTHEPRQFAGELAQLSARPSLVDAEALEPLEALVIRSDRLRDLMVQEADLGERIMRALILRRVLAGKQRKRAGHHRTGRSSGRIAPARVSRSKRATASCARL
jgi:thioredoxin reductase (NADPH)